VWKQIDDYLFLPIVKVEKLGKLKKRNSGKLELEARARGSLDLAMAIIRESMR